MKLQHSLTVISKLADRIERAVARDADGNVTLVLTLGEQLSIVILHRFAKRVVAAKESVRLLHRALTGDEELNQQELFEKPKEDV